MIHLGDIMKINGSEAPVVDCIIGGSPCQDLSVAGKRAGLAGARSGLYMEQIRIIKEMRRADELRGRSGVAVRPRYMVWENVPGAFSSNKGQDFAAVLEEAIRVSEPEAPAVGVPEKGWPTSGCFCDELGRWSVAWRVLDAQFWGVPQRRRRIALVADFGGLSAPEILFVRESVSGHPAAGGEAGKEAAPDAGDGTGGAVELDSHILDDQGGSQISVRRDGKAPTLRAETHGNLPCVMQTAGFKEHQSAEARGLGFGEEVAPTLSAQKHDASVCYTYDARGNGDGRTVNTITGDHGNLVTDYTGLVCYGIGNGQVNQGLETEMVGTLNCMHDQQAVMVPEVAHTLRAKANCDFREDSETYVVSRDDQYIVRRLTPLECERLQGFPDGWTDIGEWVDSKGKKHKEADSPRYKALGNSIAIPPWKWLLKRLCGCYERDATMASLFDGIGGFPYIWEQLNGKGSCLWASEIEEFPMAVTKLRFGGDGV